MKRIETVEISQSGSTNTTCPYCGVGCGVTVSTGGDNDVRVKGDKAHPANYGRLCVKGSALDETLSAGNRLLRPKVNGEDVSWEQALAYSSGKLKSIIEQYGPDSVAFYLSGQLLTEDYYVANKLMKGFIGSANVDTNSRLCMSSAVAAHKRAFGGDLVPGCYEDIELADFLLIVGSNTAYAHPIVFQRIAKAKKENPNLTVVVVDPRRTATCEIADIHLPIKPGSDGFFFNGLLSFIADNGCIDDEFVHQHTDGFAAALAQAKLQVPDTKSASQACDVDEDVLRQVYNYFVATDRVVTIFSQGINQSTSGCDKGNAIINCHLATGKIGKPGAAPFSITGQPNAMGGREVGGLANQLAAHMSFDVPHHVRLVEAFWQAPNMAEKEGLKAVDMFQAVNDGKIKAIWIMATNPVVSMPSADFVRTALEKCELVIVSDCVDNGDTTKTADVLFPAQGWGEKQGTATNSERCISFQKSFLKPMGEAKPDWEIISLMAQHLGFRDGFSYNHPVDIFREHARLSGFENDGQRGFDISALENITREEYETLKPTQWPITQSSPTGTQRLFGDGQFFTPSRKAQFIPIAARYPAESPTSDQLIMNTGRIRDQWHTMTRTGKASRLLSHVDEPYVQINPVDAKRFNVTANSIAHLKNHNGEFFGRVKVSTDQRQGDIFSPIHWNSAFASSSRVGALVSSNVDPVGGQPEFKHCPVSLEAFTPSVEGFCLIANDLSGSWTPAVDYWVKVTLISGTKYILANKGVDGCSIGDFKAAFPQVESWVDMSLSSGVAARAAGFIGNQLKVVVVLDSQVDKLMDSTWLESKLETEVETDIRYQLLAGSPGDGASAPGKIICSCFQVGENQIKSAIEEGCASVESLGENLKCGTNCGSCIPEIQQLIPG
ncbi:nitrate reductase [Aurantivibrio plasticivorans]